MSHKMKPRSIAGLENVSGLAEQVLAYGIATALASKLQEAIRIARDKKLDISIEVVLKVPEQPPAVEKFALPPSPPS